MTTVANLAWAYATLGVLGKGGHMGICCGKKRCYSEVAIIDVECILVDRLVLIFKRTFNQLLQGGIGGHRILDFFSGSGGHRILGFFSIEVNGIPKYAVNWWFHRRRIHILQSYINLIPGYISGML